VVENKDKLLNPILSRFCDIFVPQPKLIPNGNSINLHQYVLSQQFQNIHDELLRGNMDERLTEIRRLMTQDSKLILRPLMETVNSLYESGISCLDLMAWVKTQQAGKGSVGIPAPASTPEFLVKVVGEKYKLDLVSAPYRGSAPMMADMLGNQIAAGVGSVPDFIENHKAGKVRVVAVLGGKRQAALPDVPTFTELGLGGLEDMPYYGVFAPAGTPKATIDQFSQSLAKVLAMPDVNNHLTQMGLTVGFMTSQQLAQRERAYTQVWTRLIKASGFQPQ
jgi:hypothetical protein